MRMYTRLLVYMKPRYYSHNEDVTAEMANTAAKGIASHAEGVHTTASANYSHAEGANTAAKGIASHAEGAHSTANADYSHVEGANTIANGESSHAEGNSTITHGKNSHAEGAHTVAKGIASHAEGAHSTANADYSHAEGANTIANGESSHAEGNSTITHGKNSHAEGSYTTTGNTDDILLGDSAHAEGIHTTAEAIASHAEGIYTIAAGTASHAEGNFTVAYGDSAHAEGYFTVAEGKSTHAEGIYTIAQGKASHVEGAHTAAVGDFSHAEGVGNFSKFKGAHIMGKYGDSQEAYSWFIGNGVSPNNKELGAKWLASTRNMYIDGSTYVANGTNYAEMFEVRNGTIDVGFFVTLDGEFIRKATAQDEYILGITNDSPSILGNSAEMRWKEKYLVDEWGRIQFENINDSGAIEKRAILNPKWSPEKKYISRIERSEWVAVGLLGQMRVRDDGKCVVGSYCLPNMEGIATSNNTGYRVIKRITPNQIMIIFK